MNSSFLKLNLSDLQKALVLAVLTPVIGQIQQVVASGSLEFDWAYLGKLALSGLLGYLVKNYFSDASGKLFGKIG